ncbi:MAG: hypothetical protein HON23_00330, partial [Rickettsiales bacterium]|nr:hypothetical protein [Rickettsiales bacterium]
MMKPFLLLSTFLLLQSCAYAINQGKQKINFLSQDDSVNIIIDGKDYGILPFSTKLSRCEDHDIIFEKEDGKEKYLNLTRKRHQGLELFSIIMTGSLGIGVDDALCSLETFGESDIFVSLR